MTAEASPSARAPLWNKSMARFLNQRPRVAPHATRPTTEPLAFDSAHLTRLGINAPPSDPRLLAEFLLTEDRADAAVDADGFARGIRRALRIHLAFRAKLHEHDRQPWKVWVESHFEVGYACFNRYHIAAELQLGLVSRGLPLLTTEAQSRALAPFRRHEKFWSVLAGDAFQPELPPAAVLQVKLPALLGILHASSPITPRLRLHRTLDKLVRQTPTDAGVAPALALLRQALALLAQGSA